jgi:hypothetical protein
MQWRIHDGPDRRRLFGSLVVERRLVGLGIGIRLGLVHELGVGKRRLAVVGIERFGRFFRHELVVGRTERLRVLVGCLFGVLVRRRAGRSDARRGDDALRVA